MAARPKPFNGLRHLALKVPHFEECEQFYVEIMGMQVYRRASNNLVYLTCGNDVLSLGRIHEGKRSGIEYMDHFGFIVNTKEELQQWYDFLAEKGVELLDKPHDHGDGSRSFHCLDPVGNVIQPLYHPAVSGQQLARE